MNRASQSFLGNVDGQNIKNETKKVKFSLPAPFNVRRRRPSDECRRMEIITEALELNLSSDSSDTKE